MKFYFFFTIQTRWNIAFANVARNSSCVYTSLWRKRSPLANMQWICNYFKTFWRGERTAANGDRWQWRFHDRRYLWNTENLSFVTSPFHNKHLKKLVQSCKDVDNFILDEVISRYVSPCGSVPIAKLRSPFATISHPEPVFIMACGAEERALWHNPFVETRVFGTSGICAQAFKRFLWLLVLERMRHKIDFTRALVLRRRPWETRALGTRLHSPLFVFFWLQISKSEGFQGDEQWWASFLPY